MLKRHRFNLGFINIVALQTEDDLSRPDSVYIERKYLYAGGCAAPSISEQVEDRLVVAVKALLADRYRQHAEVHIGDVTHTLRHGWVY